MADKINEYRRKCNECGKVWHSLEAREKELERDTRIAASNQCSNAFTCRTGSALQAQKNVGSFKDSLSKLRSCPECGSHNYDEELKSYEKK